MHASYSVFYAPQKIVLTKRVYFSNIWHQVLFYYSRVNWHYYCFCPTGLLSIRCVEFYCKHFFRVWVYCEIVYFLVGRFCFICVCPAELFIFTKSEWQQIIWMYNSATCGYWKCVIISKLMHFSKDNTKIGITDITILEPKNKKSFYVIAVK